MDATNEAREGTYQPSPSRCYVCNASLSRYNNTGKCFHHKVDEYLKKAERLSEEMQETLLAFCQEFDQQEQEDLMEYLKRENLLESDLPCTQTLARDTRGQIQALHPDIVTRSVCGEYGLTTNALYEHYRGTSVVIARQALMYLLYNDACLSYPEIGKRMAGRDHTTIMHGVKKITQMIHESELLAEQIERIRSHYSDT